MAFILTRNIQSCQALVYYSQFEFEDPSVAIPSPVVVVSDERLATLKRSLEEHANGLVAVALRRHEDPSNDAMSPAFKLVRGLFLLTWGGLAAMAPVPPLAALGAAVLNRGAQDVSEVLQ
jgi:hypothetical protein